MIKSWRIIILLLCVLGALFSIFLKPQYTGVEIAYIEKNSVVNNVLKNGMIISEVNGVRIRNVEDWNKIIKNINGSVFLTVNKKRYEFKVNSSKELGIEVVDIERTNLDFGLDIKGGTRIILKPVGNTSKEMIKQIIATLQTRANIYGLKEIKFIPIRSIDGNYYIQVEAAGIGRGIVEDLLSRQGSFEAKVIKPVFLKNNKGKFKLGKNEYEIRYENETVRIGNITVRINESFNLEGIEFEFVNVSSNELFFLAKVYDGSDIELVYTDPQHSGIIPRKNYYQFYFVVLISQQGAERFAKVTAGIPSQMDMYSGEYYLKDSRIILYIDKKPVSDLRIAASLAGKVYTTPQVEGSRTNMQDAVNEKLRLQSILRSGALPVKLETVSVGIVSPTLGKDFMKSAIITGLIAALSVIIIVFIRYRSLRFSLPMVFTSMSEAVIITGIAATNDTIPWLSILIANIAVIIYALYKKEDIDISAWIGALLIPLLGMTFSWTIDLPAIAGIIAALGTGIDNMIIIADETIHKESGEKVTFTLKEKIKHAFFIIFGTASTTIAAMFPLMIIGIGLVRGFAITTIIGVLIGVLISRPAYARIIEITSK